MIREMKVMKGYLKNNCKGKDNVPFHMCVGG